ALREGRTERQEGAEAVAQDVDEHPARVDQVAERPGGVLADQLDVPVKGLTLRPVVERGGHAVDLGGNLPDEGLQLAEGADYALHAEVDALQDLVAVAVAEAGDGLVQGVLTLDELLLLRREGLTCLGHPVGCIYRVFER